MAKAAKGVQFPAPKWIARKDAFHWFAEITDLALAELRERGEAICQSHAICLYSVESLVGVTGESPDISAVSAAASVAYARQLGRDNVKRGTVVGWRNGGHLPFQKLSQDFLYDLARLHALITAPELPADGTYTDEGGKRRIVERFAIERYPFTRAALRGGLSDWLPRPTQPEEAFFRYGKRRHTHKYQGYLVDDLDEAKALREELLPAARRPRPQFANTLEEEYLFCDEFARRFNLPEDSVRHWGDPANGCPILGGCRISKKHRRNRLRPDPIRTVKKPRKWTGPKGACLRLQTAFSVEDGETIKRNLSRRTTAPDDYIPVTKACNELGVSESNYRAYRDRKPLGVELEMRQFWAAGRGKRRNDHRGIGPLWSLQWYVLNKDHERLKAARESSAAIDGRRKRAVVQMRRCDALDVAKRHGQPRLRNNENGRFASSTMPSAPSETDEGLAPVVDLAAELKVPASALYDAIRRDGLHFERRPRKPEFSNSPETDGSSQSGNRDPVHLNGAVPDTQSAPVGAAAFDESPYVLVGTKQAQFEYTRWQFARLLKDHGNCLGDKGVPECDPGPADKSIRYYKPRSNRTLVHAGDCDRVIPQLERESQKREAAEQSRGERRKAGIQGRS